MVEIKLTKNELRSQQNKLKQLERYLPTLELKKAMLQSEVTAVRLAIHEAQVSLEGRAGDVKHYASLLTAPLWIDLVNCSKAQHVHRSWENIAGVEVPSLSGVDFFESDYSVVDTPPWVDAALEGMRKLTVAKVNVAVLYEKKSALEGELREVSIRLNLFKKVLIPRAAANIKKIRVFLGDQQLAAVAQAKVAKSKIEKKKSQKSQSLGKEKSCASM